MRIFIFHCIFISSLLSFPVYSTSQPPTSPLLFWLKCFADIFIPFVHIANARYRQPLFFFYLRMDTFDSFGVFLYLILSFSNIFAFYFLFLFTFIMPFLFAYPCFCTDVLLEFLHLPGNIEYIYMFEALLEVDEFRCSIEGWNGF